MLKKLKRSLGLIKKLSDVEFEVKLRKTFFDILERHNSSEPESRQNHFVFYRKLMEVLTEDDEVIMYVGQIILDESPALKEALRRVLTDHYEKLGSRQVAANVERDAEYIENDLRRHTVYLTKYYAGFEDE